MKTRNKMFKKLEREFTELDYDLQIHALMIIDIVKEIAQLSGKKPDMDIIIACAVLHDSKNHETNHEKAGAEYAKKVLTKLKFPKPFIEKVSDIIQNHTEKQKTKDFTTACFYDADILCRFYSLGILRAWVNIKSGNKNWKNLFLKLSNEKQLKSYLKTMKNKLQLKASKVLLERKAKEFLAAHGLLKKLLF